MLLAVKRTSCLLQNIHFYWENWKNVLRFRLTDVIYISLLVILYRYYDGRTLSVLIAEKRNAFMNKKDVMLKIKQIFIHRTVTFKYSCVERICNTFFFLFLHLRFGPHFRRGWKWHEVSNKHAIDKTYTIKTG